jgi:hypothetical protein
VYRIQNLKKRPRSNEDCRAIDRGDRSNEIGLLCQSVKSRDRWDSYEVIIGIINIITSTGNARLVLLSAPRCRPNWPFDIFFAPAFSVSFHPLFIPVFYVSSFRIPVCVVQISQITSEYLRYSGVIYMYNAGFG